MKNGDKPAYGWTASMAPNVQVTSQGLTKRELFAAMAMKGLLANSFDGHRNQPLSTASPSEIAQISVEQADALLAELERTP